MSRPEVYVSIDVESDGPIPGPYSMLSYGAVAFNAIRGEEVGSITANLFPLPGATSHPETMAWWEKNPDAWRAVQENRRDSQAAMTEFHDWLEALPGRPVFVGYPVTYDFMFLYWYLVYFTQSCPAGFQGLGLKTAAWAALGGDFCRVSKRTMPREWFSPQVPHTHIALDDAREQGYLFFQIRKALNGMRGTDAAKVVGERVRL